LPATAEATVLSLSIPLTEEEREILEKQPTQSDVHPAEVAEPEEEPETRRIIALDNDNEQPSKDDPRTGTGFAII
jgi:hypothetical protein